MPLVLEAVTKPTEQDLVDLGKIREEMGESAEETAAWVEQIVANPGQQLFATRFNDRLLAIAQIESTANQWEVTLVMVREITRRRGVGRYLLEAVANEALRSGATTVMKVPVGNEAMVGLCRSLHWHESSTDEEFFFSNH